ncbi:E3 ubiquitin-protein ligase ATL41-like [Magnolia sinica]|uniref:E3 ubiquitin-protein ligase ATL41-like n=1 Tax=Magnolia sinica TaxID=86752 RepID=UPI00265AD035|nr:E3 ubiquitin-protein ligase ATL41-like [Magnolia sinica]
MQTIPSTLCPLSLLIAMSDDDHHKRRHHYGVSNKAMLIAFGSLLIVVGLVILLHLYVRRVARRQARRRFLIGHLATAAQRGTPEPPKTGLDPSVIDTLPIFTYKRSDPLNDTGAECSVCLSALEEEEIARILPNCKHMFHLQCIDMWLHSHSTCPICRTDAEPQAQEATAPMVFVASAPPLDRTMSMASEGPSDAVGQSSKGGESGSRLSSFRRIITREKSDRRMQSCGQADAVEDIERQ